MLQVSRKVDYGVMVLASLPEWDTDEYRSLQDIAHEKSLSAGFLGQVMMPLKQAGLVRSREGVGGGYQLARSSEEITLADIFTALEGSPQLVACQNSAQSCVCEKNCPTKSLWGDLQQMMVDYLTSRRLAEFRMPDAHTLMSDVHTLI